LTKFKAFTGAADYKSGSPFVTVATGNRTSDPYTRSARFAETQRGERIKRKQNQNYEQRQIRQGRNPNDSRQSIGNPKRNSESARRASRKRQLRGAGAKCSSDKRGHRERWDRVGWR
jgi:hypothetical protein